MIREWRGVLRYAGPMVLADGIHTATPVIVVALIGAMGGEALYVRSLFMPVVFAYVAIHLSIGVTTQVAVALGAGRGYDTAAASARWLMRVGLAATAVLSAALVVGAPLLADLLSVQEEVRAQFVWFVRWVALAQMVGIGPGVCASVLRGAERPRAAAGVLLLAGGVEAAAVAALGLPAGAGWGLWSVPVAMAAYGMLGTAFGLWMIVRAGLWKPGRRRESALLRQVGLPVGGGYIVIFASNFALTWVVSVFGAATVAGFAVAYTLQTMIIVPGMAIGSATAIVANQCRGRGEYARVSDVVRAGLAITGAVYAALAATCWLAREPLAHAVAQEPAAAAEAAGFLALLAPTYLVLGVVLASLSVLEQTGAGALALVLNVAYFAAICVVGGFLARATGEATPLYQTMAAVNLTGAVVVLAALWHVRRLVRPAQHSPKAADRAPRAPAGQ